MLRALRTANAKLPTTRMSSDCGRYFLRVHLHFARLINIERPCVPGSMMYRCVSKHHGLTLCTSQTLPRSRSTSKRRASQSLDRVLEASPGRGERYRTEPVCFTSTLRCSSRHLTHKHCADSSTARSSTLLATGNDLERPITVANQYTRVAVEIPPAKKKMDAYAGISQ